MWCYGVGAGFSWNDVASRAPLSHETLDPTAFRAFGIGLQIFQLLMGFLSCHCTRADVARQRKLGQQTFEMSPVEWRNTSGDGELAMAVVE